MKMHNKVRQILSTGLFLLIFSPISALLGSPACQVNIENGTNGMTLNILDSQDNLIKTLSPGESDILVLEEKPEFIKFSSTIKDVSLLYDIYRHPDHKNFAIFLDEIDNPSTYYNLKAIESFYGNIEASHSYFIEISGEAIIHKSEIEPYRYKIIIKGGKMKEDL